MEVSDKDYETITKLEELGVQQSYASALAKTLDETWYRLGRSAKREYQSAPLMTWNEIMRIYEQTEDLFLILNECLANIDGITNETIELLIDQRRKKGAYDEN